MTWIIPRLTQVVSNTLNKPQSKWQASRKTGDNSGSCTRNPNFGDMFNLEKQLKASCPYKTLGDFELESNTYSPSGWLLLQGYHLHCGVVPPLKKWGNKGYFLYAIMHYVHFDFVEPQVPTKQYKLSFSKKCVLYILSRGPITLFSVCYWIQGT